MSVRIHRPTLSQNRIPDSVSTPLLEAITTVITDASAVLVSWTDPNPPLLRNYDPHVNTQDPAPSVQNVLSTILDIRPYISGTKGTATITMEYFDDNDPSTLQVSNTITIQYDLATAPNTNGKLWGNPHGVTNNTNQYLGNDPSSSKAYAAQAIPFRSIHSTITGLQVFMRPDNQAHRLGHYTVGDGGTVRKMIVGNTANNEPDMNNIIAQTVEHAGDVSRWGPIGTNSTITSSDIAAAKTDHQSSYPGSDLFAENSRWSTGLDLYKHTIPSATVTLGEIYWLVAEQVRGDSTDYPSVNYFRSGTSADYAGNYLTRFQDTSASGPILPKQRKSSGDGWIDLNRHPVYAVHGDGGVQGISYYNHGRAPDNEASDDRTTNVTATNWVRNTWTVPAGGLTLNRVHLCMSRQSGSGDVELRIDGNLVAAFDGASFPQNFTEDYPAAFETAAWRSLDITPVSVSGTAVLEVRATGSLNIEIGHAKEPAATQSTPYIEMQPGDCGTPDVISGYSDDSGATWDDNLDSNRIKYNIAVNQT